MVKAGILLSSVDNAKTDEVSPALKISVEGKLFLLIFIYNHYANT